MKLEMERTSWGYPSVARKPASMSETADVQLGEEYSALQTELLWN